MSRFSALILVLVLAAFAVFLQSCETEGTDESAPYETFSANTQVSFPMLQQMVLSSCLKCHGDFSSQSGVDAYITPGDPDDSELYQMVESGEMPKGGPPLSADQIAMVKAYIEQQKQVTPVEPTWASLQVTLVEASCIACHTQGSKQPYFDTYDEVVQNAYDMEDMLSEGKMPPKGHAAPSAAVKQAFIDWINAGFPEQ